MDNLIDRSQFKSFKHVKHVLKQSNPNIKDKEIKDDYHIFIGTNNRYAFAYPVDNKTANTATRTLISLK